MKISLIVGLLVVLLVSGAQAGLWVTLTSASSSCGSLTSDSYLWDTQNTFPSSLCTGVYPYGTCDANDIRQYFCTGYVDSMPIGSYCFYQNRQNSQACPTGFVQGTRTQNDEDGSNHSGPKENKNTLPKKDFLGGSHNSVTKWYFCCKDGTPSTSISFDSIRTQLPDVFMLFRKGGSCQVIAGTTSQEGNVFWDDEDFVFTTSANDVSGTLPDGVYTGNNDNTEMNYCTYTYFVPLPPTNLKLTSKSSTSVSISWTASAGTSIYYKIVISPAAVSPSTKYTTTTKTLSPLTPSTTYTITIYGGKNHPTTGAETYETIGTSIQFTTCSSEYTGLNCDQPVCNPTCAHGTCDAPNVCTCTTGWGGSTCNECTNGYYPKNGNCLECNCNNHGVCSDGPTGNGSCACNTGYTTPVSSTDYCTSCSSGYVMEGSNCVKCYETCETCEFNSTYCISCKSGFVLEFNKCRSTCEVGKYYSYVSSDCQPCSTSCVTCFGGNNNECLSCPNDLLLEAGSCVTNCSVGNYPDDDKICQACQFPCSTCNGPENGNCLTCISPYIQKETFCLTETQCLQNGYIDSNRACQECDETCSRCYGPNNDQCLACPDGTFLLNGKCIDDCPIGYYANTTSNKCQACSSRCSECFGINENECSSCNSPFLMNSTTCVSTLECSNFGYKDNTFCHPCSSSCSKCNGPLSTNCVTCPESKYLLNGECLNECPAGYFISGGQCQLCSFPCLNCENESTTCLNCIESYSLSGTTCISNEECYLSGYVSNGVCYECNLNCSTCSGPTSNECLSCLRPKVLLEGTCDNECPSNSYYFVNNTNSCEKCDVSCSGCSGGGINDCLKCSPNFYTHNGQCLAECPDGYYNDASLGKCVNCPQLCLTCSSASFCMSCITDYSLFGGECVDKCPDGYTSNSGICSEKQNQSQNQIGLGVGLGVGLLFLILLVLLILFFIRKQKKKQEKKFTEITMEASDNYHLTIGSDKFSSRRVSMDSQSMPGSGQATLLNTQIDIALPGFLLLNLTEDIRITKEIATGGASSLYAGEIINPELMDKFDTKFVVVKYLKPLPGISQEDSLQYFHDEITVNWTLNFEPNIIRMVGYCDEPRCIVSKLYERDLYSLIHDPSEYLSPLRICTLILHIAKGIQAIHRIKAAHRDLKTKNILVERGLSDDDGDIRAVICDFGLAVMSQTRVGRAPQLQSLKGLSVQYAAPEVFTEMTNFSSKQVNEKNSKIGKGRSKSVASTKTTTQEDDVEGNNIQNYQKADIYSFAIIMWELLTREIPWDGSDAVEIEVGVKNGQRLKFEDPQSSEAITFLWKTIQSCWNEDPSQRPAISSLIPKIDIQRSDLLPNRDLY